MVYRTAPFPMILNHPTPSFKVTPFFYAEYLRNGKRYRHSFNEILIGTYTSPTHRCYFEWSWVTLGDLTRSVARSLCDGWASSDNWVTRCMPILVGSEARWVAENVCMCVVGVCEQPMRASVQMSQRPSTLQDVAHYQRRLWLLPHLSSSAGRFVWFSRQVRRGQRIALRLLAWWRSSRHL